MEHGPGKGIGSQQGKPEHDVGYLAYRGIGQPFFENLLPVGQHGAHEHGQQRQRHPGLLHPSPPQELRPHDVEHHPDHSQHAGLYDDGREHRGRRGRGHGMGRGEPGVERHHAGLGPEAQERGEHGDQQDSLMSLRCRHVQCPPCRKGQSIAVAI